MSNNQNSVIFDLSKAIQSKRIALVVVLFCAAFLTSCVTPRKDSTGSTTAGLGERIDPETLQNLEVATEEDKNPDSAVDPIEPEPVDMNVIGFLPPEMQKHVDKWIEYFTKKDRDRFQRYLNQGAKYRAVVENVLLDSELPKELYYLAMIESGYHTHARSRARAIGVWQFIRGTGKRYGLQIDGWVDERRDPIRATEAAARYLRDLYNVFGNWHLALAGYNAGEHRVVGAVVRGKSRSYWDLVQKKVLPRETAAYVPKLLAAIEIGDHPEKYGFEPPQIEQTPPLDSVEVPSPIRVEEIAKILGISTEEFLKYNPHLSKKITPPGEATYEVWVPHSQTELVASAKNDLAQKRLKNIRRTYASSGKTHRIQRGETLSGIARRYQLSVAYLKKINNLSNSSRIYAGQRLRVTAKAYHPKQIKKYQVQRGDSLYRIARKFGMTISQIKDLNNLDSSQINRGQWLRVRSL